MKYIKYLFVFLISCSSLIAAPKSGFIQKLNKGKKIKIVAYGTSLTQHGAWVDQVAQALHQKFPKQVEMINSGGAGKYSKWGVENLEKKVLSKNPDVVFMEFSINDSVQRFHCSVDQAKSNLLDMISRIKKKNSRCEIILMTMTPANKFSKGDYSYRQDINQHYEMVRKVAKKNKFLCIDHYKNWMALLKKDKKTYNRYNPDSIHPTAEGCENLVTPEILKSIGLKK